MTEPVEWQAEFQNNYSVLKSLAGKVPAKLQPLYASLMRQAQQIQYGFDNHLYLSAAESDGVDQWFANVRKFAQAIGTVPVPSQVDVTPPDTTPISDPIFYGVDDALHGRWPVDVAQFENELERIAIFVALGIGALVLGPPLIRMVSGRR